MISVNRRVHSATILVGIFAMAGWSRGPADAAIPQPSATVTPMAGMTMAPMPRTSAKPKAQPTMAPMQGMSDSTVPSAAPSEMPTPMFPMMDMRSSGGVAESDMASPINLADSMSQDGSGTSWVPKSTQMFGWMRMGARDMQMTHGAIFPRYVSSGSQRGDRRADAPNWFMLMGTHAISASSQFGYAAMFSADTLTENRSGYPLLFQTGETAFGQPLHDHQHPHDLVSELAVTYSARIGPVASTYVYVGYPGEPALGPTAFMHRRIAYDMPESTIGHHWQDASHIQFGVATFGFAPNARVKVEASTFTGREPNEYRTNFDPIHLDSYSERLSWSPNDNTSAEVSYAFIKSPEVSNPLVDQHRLVGSVLFNVPRGLDRNWYTGLVFGQNIESGGGRTSSYLAETDLQNRRNTLFARIEIGTRSARDLVIPGIDSEKVFTVGSYAFGFVHDLMRNPAAVNIGLGAEVTLGSKSAGLEQTYGSGTPLGYQVYFRVRPPDMAHTMASMSGMSMGAH